MPAALYWYTDGTVIDARCCEGSTFNTTAMKNITKLSFSSTSLPKALLWHARWLIHFSFRTRSHSSALHYGLLMPIMFAFGPLVAQYSPVLDSQKEWNGSAYLYGHIPERTLVVDYILPDEVTIEGETYVHLFSEGPNWFDAYLREDTALGKVWIRYEHVNWNGSGANESFFSDEILLFDYGLNEGDPFTMQLCSIADTFQDSTVFYYPTIPMTVTEVSYTDNRKVITIEPDTAMEQYFSPSQGYPFTFPYYAGLMFPTFGGFSEFDQLVTAVMQYQFIEGIGSNFGFFFPHVAPEGSSHVEYLLHCVTESDSMIWHNPAVLSECDGWPIDIALSTSAASKQPAVTLYPNPVYDRLFVELPEANVAAWHLRIFDLHGMIVQEQRSFTGGSLPVNALPPGMYLLQATSADGRIGVQKFVKRQ